MTDLPKINFQLKQANIRRMQFGKNSPLAKLQLQQTNKGFSSIQELEEIQ